MTGIARKQRNDARLKAAGVPVNAWLPHLVDDDSEATLRPAGAVAARVLTLCGVGAVASGFPRTDVVKWLEAEGLWSDLSPREAQFLRNPNPPRQEAIELSWSPEAMLPLLWCLGRFPEMGWPGGECDVGELVSHIPRLGAPTAHFIQGAELRPVSEILDEADLIYRIHWAVRENQLRSRQPLPGLHPAVVFERHRALNWVLGDEPWDEVDTST